MSNRPDPFQIRKQSKKLVAELEYSFNDQLPVLPDNLRARGEREIINRALALFVVVGVASGGNQGSAMSWLAKEAIAGALTPAESRWLENQEGDMRPAFVAQEESLLALAWALGFIKKLDFGRHCALSLSAAFPKPRLGESSDAFRQSAKMRAVSDIVEALDLAYCLHWSIRNEELQGRIVSHAVDPHVVIERRRALEWILSNEDWDSVPMDT
jgi:hypothetical protein